MCCLLFVSCAIKSKYLKLSLSLWVKKRTCLIEIYQFSWHSATKVCKSVMISAAKDQRETPETICLVYADTWPAAAAATSGSACDQLRMREEIRT